jgi:aspartate/methionine/tyrosine aminotransferase
MRIPPFRLERFFAQYEFKAKYLLSSSDCESLSIQDLLALEPGAAERFQAHWLGYTESQGSPELRQAISQLYERIMPGDILVHAGAEEAIFIFMNAMLEAGDHVVVHYPCYQSLAEVARSIGCDVTEWRTAEQDVWELDIDFLRKSIRPNTRAIVVNCPHNPTGYLMSRDKQQEIIAIAAEHDILVFSDEVYRFLEHNPDDRLPAACNLYDNAVSLGVMSKTFGLAGLRIGWIATRNPEVYQRMAAFKDYTSICNSAPSEFLAAVALRNREPIIRRNLAIVRENLGVLDAFFARRHEVFAWSRPKAGSTAFPSLQIERDIETFCVELVEATGVLLLPGTCFDAGNRHFRVGFGRKNLPECIEKFDAFIDEHAVQGGIA